MAITQPVMYSAKSRRLVAGFARRRTQTGAYWTDDALKQVRREIKNHYIRVQQRRCCYCQQLINSTRHRSWDAEHVLSRSTYPQFLLEPRNLAVACIDCNQAKSNADVLAVALGSGYPSQGAAFTIVHPHFDDYATHVHRLNDWAYFGRTTKGSNTLHICNVWRYAAHYLGQGERIADAAAIRALGRQVMNAETPDAMQAALVQLVLVGTTQMGADLLRALRVTSECTLPHAPAPQRMRGRAKSARGTKRPSGTRPARGGRTTSGLTSTKR